MTLEDRVNDIFRRKLEKYKKPVRGKGMRTMSKNNLDLARALVDGEILRSPNEVVRFFEDPRRYRREFKLLEEFRRIKLAVVDNCIEPEEPDTNTLVADGVIVHPNWTSATRGIAYFDVFDFEGHHELLADDVIDRILRPGEPS